MKPGDIVRVVQLGRSGHSFKAPAYAVLLGHAGPDQQSSLKFVLMAACDADPMLAISAYHRLASDATGFTAFPANLVELTEDERVVIAAMVALRGRGLVITREPVSLSN